MTEKDKRRDIDRLCGGGGVVFTGSGTKAKKHPGQVRRPGRSGGTGSKGFFKAAVDLIHYTVGGGMVGGGGDEGDIKEGGEGGPEMMREGTPKQVIQAVKRVLAVVSAKGTASTQRVELSMIVKM